MLPAPVNHKLKQTANGEQNLWWRSAAKTHVGMVRKINEDSVFGKNELGIWAVADGMGGYEAGEVASQMIVHSLGNLPSMSRLSQFVESVDNELREVNRRIQQHSMMIIEGRMLGSTVVALIIRGQVGVCLWAGDSRLYQYRGGKLQRLSKDHSRVEELIDEGILLPEEARKHPQSNVITRAVGACADLYLDNCVFDVKPEDTFLLCSDGLYNSVRDDEITAKLQHADPQLCAEGLIDSALANNANDNVSAVVVRADGKAIHA
ncbi:MAG TPA: protein phosphatase 2C domain-containing protein [Gammaproteobacteria bacterium]